MTDRTRSTEPTASSAIAASKSEPAASRQIPAGTTLILAALVFAVLRQGAYHQWPHQVFAGLVVGAAALLLGNQAGRSAMAVAAVVVTPVLLSSLLSTALSDDRSDARSTILEIVLIGVGLAAGAAIPADRQDIVVHGFLFIATVVAATAIYGVATHSTPWGRVTGSTWRGSSSLTYSNAAASVVGPGALLAFSHAARSGHRGYAVVSSALTIGLVSTQSRAGLAATLVVALWLVLRLGVRNWAEAALPIAAGVFIGLPLALVFASDDRSAQPAAVFVAILIGLAVTMFGWPMRTRVQRPQAVLAGSFAVAVAFAAATGTLTSLTERLTLRSGTTAQGQDAAVLFGDRAKEWSTAWERVSERPIAGHGPGVVDLRWIEDGRTFRALFVHNEYLELAVTQGMIGLFALVASVLLYRHFRRRPALGLPVLFAVATYLLHSTFDYLWHLPALPVLFAVLAGTSLEVRSTPIRRGLQRQR